MSKSKRVAKYLEPDEASADEGRSFLKSKKFTLAMLGVLATVTFFGGLVLGLYNFINYKYEATPKGEAGQVVFNVERGNGLSTIAANLEEQGLVDKAFIFKLVTKMRGNEANFKAGEYAISTPASMSEIYTVLSEGQAILYPFTAPEGLTSAQIMRAITTVPTLVNDMTDIPAEGTLLPETYLTPRDMTYSAVIAKMQAAQTDLIDALWEGRQADLPIKTKEEAIILASVVEKETGIGSERNMVAGVFINRLNRGMRLESDPTIIYGLTQGEPLGRGLRRSEIDRKTDWNTYQISGLPKTPICNPGRDAIAAVLNPAVTDAIFFVADGSGGHAFSSTLSGHNKNVANWRKIERARRNSGTQ